MNTLPEIHGMWIGQRLSSMELLTISSFTSRNHVFRLWAYDEIENVPTNVLLMDAGQIVAREAVFSYSNSNKFGHGKGSYAGFSDLFRYKLLHEYGGIWVDMDMTCLANLPVDRDYHFRHHKKTGIVGNYIKCPPQSELMAWCYQQAHGSMNADNRNWMLPIEILNAGIKKFKPDSLVLKASNDDSFPIVSEYLRSNSSVSKDWVLMHWMNEEFRRLELPKDACLGNSAFHQLCLKHKVPVKVLSGLQAIVYKWKISRINYILLSLKARIKWQLGNVFRGRQD